MLGRSRHLSIALSGFLFSLGSDDLLAEQLVEDSYFEGRWAFTDEDCNAPTNWTMIAGGNFVSNDLVGTWQWIDGKLVLNLTDLSEDEEIGETGDRFVMEGPVEFVDEATFRFNIAPDIYEMRKCPGY